MKSINWLEFAIFTVFTVAVIGIGLPSSLYLLKKGFEGVQKYKFRKLPKNFLAISGCGNFSLEILFYGVFLLSFSLWYLFFDHGGQLNIWFQSVKVMIGK